MSTTHTPTNPVQTPENEFRQFMRGISSDARLGRLFPGDLQRQSAEVVVLSLASRLADAVEGNRGVNPAFRTLEELDAEAAR